jgi:hypothetical protein
MLKTKPESNSDPIAETRDPYDYRSQIGPPHVAPGSGAKARIAKVDHDPAETPETQS